MRVAVPRIALTPTAPALNFMSLSHRVTAAALRAGRAAVRRASRGAAVLLTVVALAIAGDAAAVTVSVPPDLAIAPGGAVDVPLTLANDVPVRALFARIQEVPD